MFSDVILIHRPGGKGSQTLQPALNEAVSQEFARHWFFWQTCLRQIAIADELTVGALKAKLEPGDEVYQGEAAYGFLLEIICGLHSPLLGETEVYGQFKNAVASFQTPLTPWGSHLKRFFKALFEDAKRIRQAHLEDLGSQSYGSVLRRELRGLKHIHILGAGQLVQEVLPWLTKDGNEVHVHARDTVKAREQLAGVLKTGSSQVHTLPAGHGELGVLPVHTDDTDLAHAQAVIIAAPVSAKFIEHWLKGLPNLRVIADLRADSASDIPQFTAETYLVLGDVFSRITQNQALLADRKKAALTAVAVAVHERNSYVEYRPFGWEDVCA
jgi:glutamyl-tRNA reductase